MYGLNWKCGNTDCKRHHENQPWNVVTRQRKWEPKNNNECEGELLKYESNIVHDGVSAV